MPEEIRAAELTADHRKYSAPEPNSLVAICTPPAVAWKIYWWIPVMPAAVPPHSARVASYLVTVEVAGKPKLLQLKETPGSIRRPRCAPR